MRDEGSAERRPTRRGFLKSAAAGALAAGPLRYARAEDDVPPARAVTAGPNHHFFGYYDKTPWDLSGRHLLALRVGFVGRQPEPAEEAILGRVDLQDGYRFLPFASTRAWCWQQGTMLHWMPTAPDREVIYNSIEKGAFVSVVHDVVADTKRTLPQAIYCISGDGRQAIGLNFARLHRCRPGYGYVGVADRWESDPAPEEDGLFRMDLGTGETRLLFSYAAAVRNKPRPDFAGATHNFNHCQFNPGGSRFIFLHRWGKPGGRRTTRLYTLGADGTDLRLLSDHDMTSHFDWRDDRTILAWARGPNGKDRFYRIGDGDGKFEEAGGGLPTVDGHCSYSPDRKWILNDTYPDRESRRHLMLVRVADGRRFDLGRFHSPPALEGPARCDLHPRWNRDGTQVCFDSAHEPTRQMYVIDVSRITRA